MTTSICLYQSIVPAPSLPVPVPVPVPLQATFLEMDYWMLPVNTPKRNADFTAPVDQVRAVLAQVLPPPLETPESEMSP